MKKMLTFLFVLVLLIACNPDIKDTKISKNETEIENTDTEQDVQGEIFKEENHFYFDAAYATNTLIPYEKYGIEQMFDGQKDTYWASSKGAGPDEGIMLYPPDNVDIRAIEIHALKNDKFSQIQVVKIYVNGQDLGEYDLGDFIDLNVEGKVRAIYIKIEKVADMDILETMDENTGEEHTFESFAKNKSIAIAEINCFDAHDKRLEMHVPEKIPAKIEVSSTLKPVSAYSVMHLFDSRRDFSWAEAADNSGEGQQISIDFQKNINIDELIIWNGYQRSDEHFSANARAKHISLIDETGAKQNLLLADTQGAQKIKFEKAIKSRFFKIVVDDVFPGEKYTDLVISDIAFGNKGRTFLPDNKEWQQKLVAETKEKARQTPLNEVLDRRFKSVDFQSEFSYVVDKSIILRSDKTFVIYDFQTSGEAKNKSTTETIGEGNWEFVSVGTQKVELDIFGKLVNRSSNFDPYKGRSDAKYLRIFKDRLTIDKNQISGQKFIGTFQIKLKSTSFVDVKTLDKSLIVEMPYTTEDNFTGKKLYPCERCLLRLAVAQALIDANHEFNRDGYKIKLMDCYRPLSVQKYMWKIYPVPGYVADPAKGSVHNRGGAVDLTLVTLDGGYVDMGTTFDFFGKEAHHDFTNLPANILENRKYLRETLAKHGFSHIRTEWWHYNYKGASKFPISDLPLCG